MNRRTYEKDDPLSPSISQPIHPSSSGLYFSALAAKHLRLNTKYVSPILWETRFSTILYSQPRDVRLHAQLHLFAFLNRLEIGSRSAGSMVRKLNRASHGVPYGVSL